MDEFLTSISVEFLKVAVSESAKKIVSRKWSFGTGECVPLVEQLCDEDVAHAYSEKYISKILKFRTLNSANADIYLDQIYTPLRVKSHKTREIIIVDSDSSLYDSEVINIVGFAGQGKSTILRKLLLEELIKGDRFPFFIELRNLSNQTILENLREQLKRIGCDFDENEAQLEYFIQSKECLIFLDGFDEVSSGKRNLILNEIMDLNTRFNAEIIVSSRPDTEICRKVGVHSYDVLRLEIDDVIQILERVDSLFEEGYSDLTDIVRKNISLSRTLVSPILVSLLYAVYPHLSSIPENVIDFYQDLFSSLYTKHDKLKNFKREKKSTLNVKEAGDVFNTFCFFSLYKGVLEFNEDTFLEIIQHILKAKDIVGESPENVMDDIINISCLIQRDGHDHFVFIHKSIQEFHAAKFLNQMPYLDKKRTYDLVCRKIAQEDSFDNVIKFLKDLNYADYSNLIVCNVLSFFDFDLSDESEIREYFLNRLGEVFLNAVFEDELWILSSETEFIEFYSVLFFLKSGRREYKSNMDVKLNNLICDCFEEEDVQRSLHKILSNRKEKQISLNEFLTIIDCAEEFIDESIEEFLFFINSISKVNNNMSSFDELYSLKL